MSSDLRASDLQPCIAGLGLGGASLLRHLSSWTLTSVSGFSGAVASVLQRSLAADASSRYTSQPGYNAACAHRQHVAFSGQMAVSDNVSEAHSAEGHLGPLLCRL